MAFIHFSLIFVFWMLVAPAHGDPLESPVEVFDLCEGNSGFNPQHQTSYEVVVPVELKAPKTAEEELVNQEAIHKQFEAVRGPIANAGS